MPEAKILVDRAFFVRKVQPVLEPMGWTVNYAVTDSPAGYIVIHDISDTLEHVIAPELRKKFTSILDALAAPLNDAGGKSHWHYATDEDRLQWHETGDGAIAPVPVFRQEFAVTPPSEPDKQPVPPQKRPVFDYITLRKDPENDRRIQEYSNTPIAVKSEDLVHLVKAEFAARGWIYSGTHYGGGSVELHVVLSADDKVVAPAEVLEALRHLGVPYTVGYRSQEPADEVVEDDWEDEEEGEDGRVFLDAAEAERQETPQAAMEAEEEEPEIGPGAVLNQVVPRFTFIEDAPGAQLDATGALRLEEGQKMHIEGVCDHASDAAELRLELGDNIITIVSSYRQTVEFLMEATNLACELMAEKGRILATGTGAIIAGHPPLLKIKIEEPEEETESDGGKEPERDEFAEQRQSNQ